jgi:aspartyl-tRNA(Asn)/glutamyl-tRNA(Gln) amidotransferase subunit B
MSPAQLGGIIDLIKEGVISGKIAKDLFEIVWTKAAIRARSLKPVA